ncbi:MAG: holo-ACP synthase [Pseudomonadota bacterium]
MILGIGVDLVDVRRIESAIFRWEERFLRMLFTDNEIRYCNNKKNPAIRFATRFAAKQALIKALFSKEERTVDYRLIEIDQDEEGRPTAVLSGKLKNRYKELSVKKVHLMISHDGNYGVANVVVEG